MQMLRRVRRPAPGDFVAADGVEPVEARDARELCVVELRSPDRFSRRGDRASTRIPAVVRAVGAGVGTGSLGTGSVPH